MIQVRLHHSAPVLASCVPPRILTRASGKSIADLRFGSRDSDGIVSHAGIIANEAQLRQLPGHGALDAGALLYDSTLRIRRSGPVKLRRRFSAESMSACEAEARPVNRFPCDSMIKMGRPEQHQEIAGDAKGRGPV